MCQGDTKDEEEMSVDSDEEPPQSYPITTPLPVNQQSKIIKPPSSKLKVSFCSIVLYGGH